MLPRLSTVALSRLGLLVELPYDVQLRRFRWYAVCPLPRNKQWITSRKRHNGLERRQRVPNKRTPLSLADEYLHPATAGYPEMMGDGPHKYNDEAYERRKHLKHAKMRSKREDNLQRLLSQRLGTATNHDSEIAPPIGFQPFIKHLSY